MGEMEQGYGRGGSNRREWMVKAKTSQGRSRNTKRITYLKAKVSQTLGPARCETSPALPVPLDPGGALDPVKDTGPYATYGGPEASDSIWKWYWPVGARDAAGLMTDDAGPLDRGVLSLARAGRRTECVEYFAMNAACEGGPATAGLWG